MTIFLIASFLWTVSIALLVRVLRISLCGAPPSPIGRFVWPLLVCGAIVLLFRPHEDIYGGQDPGSYINSAVSYARHGSLTYVDPLLAQVEKKDRPLFFYGHTGFRQTKGACLWVKDLEKATVGPWFQPAYPIMMSLIARVAPPRLILYVIPLFTVLTALVLAVLAGILLPGNRAGIVAFLFYVLNPNTAWHGRCPRPEIIAGFLVLGGWTLLLHDAGKKRGPQPEMTDPLLASLALACAPFFHITAWFAIIPISLWTAVMILRGHIRYLVYAPIMLAALVATMYQALRITDCYKIGRTLLALPLTPPTLFAALAIAIALFALLTVSKARLKEDENEADGATSRHSAYRSVSLLLAGSGALLFTAVYFEAIPVGQSLFHGIPVLSRWRVTDLPHFVVLVSRPIALLGLVGWFVLLMKNDENIDKRLATILILLPAAMLIGKIPHLMYFSRRLQPFLIPLFVLSLTALFVSIPWKHGLRRFVLPGLLAGVLLLGMRNRGHLYSLIEHRGFISSLQEIAAEIRRQDGILLCEYSRLAAPFDHFFGIPVLGIDHSRKADQYDEIAEAWSAVRQAKPVRPAYFLTPFGTSWNNRFDLLPVKLYKVKGRKLRTSTALPADISDYELDLELSLFAPPL